MIHRLIGLTNDKLNARGLRTMDIIYIWLVAQSATARRKIANLFLFGESMNQARNSSGQVTYYLYLHYRMQIETGLCFPHSRVEKLRE